MIADLKPCVCLFNTCYLNQAGLTTWSLHCLQLWCQQFCSTWSTCPKQHQRLFSILAGWWKCSIHCYIVFATNLMLLPAQSHKTNSLTFTMIEKDLSTSSFQAPATGSCRDGLALWIQWTWYIKVIWSQRLHSDSFLKLCPSFPIFQLILTLHAKKKIYIYMKRLVACGVAAHFWKSPSLSQLPFCTVGSLHPRLPSPLLWNDRCNKSRPCEPWLTHHSIRALL